MPQARRHRAWGIILAFCFLTSGFTQANSLNQTSARISSVDDLAEALLKVSGEEERAELLAGHAQLVTAELVKALNRRADRFRNQNSYSQALAAFQLAQRIGEQIGDNIGIASALSGIGRVHEQLGNYPLALENLQKSLAMRRAIGDKVEIANALRYVGILHMLQGDYAQALEHYQRSLAIHEELGNKLGIAGTLQNTGLTHFYLGNNAQALEHYQRLLAIHEDLGNKVVIASVLINVGSIHRSQGNYAQALEHYQKSLAIFEALGIKAFVSQSLQRIGLTYSTQGNYTHALDHLQKSLVMFEALGQKAGVAGVLHDIGIVHAEQGNYAQALDHYQKSLAMNEALGEKAGIAGVLSSIADVYAKQGNNDQALEHYRKGLAIFEARGDKVATGEALHNIGIVHKKQGRYPQALDFAQRAAALARQIGRIDSLWKARLTAGAAYRALNQPAQARQAFEEAITVIETLRAQVAGGEQEQQRFFESRLPPYHAMVELLVDQNNAAEALAYAERSRARVLLDVLSNGRVNITKAMTAQEQQKEQGLNTQLVSLNTQLYRENLRPQPDQARLDELQGQLRKARLEFESFQTNLYGTHPELRVRRGEAQPLRLEDASALLPDAKTALLEFVVTEEKSYLFVLTKEATVGVKVYPLEVNQKQLTDRIERFRQMLATQDNRFSKPAHELYDLLLGPAAEQLRGKSRVVIVPDGPLWELPFQALQTPRDRYLIEDQTLFYAPSVTVLREMVGARGRGAKPSAAPTLLALGNPSLGQQTIQRVKAALMDERLDPLPEAERQVQMLRRIYGADRSKVYVGAEAREELFKSEADDYRILHLATHGILNDRSPMYSHVLLAQTGDASKEDGLLEAWELMKLELKADLGVLSACETARGRVGKGEGMIGLTWGLFVAGVPTSVVSQWKVRSDSTAELMVGFHTQLKKRLARSSGGISAAEALRDAALKLKGDSRYRHPFHWAGFVVVGDGY